MKKEIVAVSGEQLNDGLFFEIKFTLKVTEPKSGQSNQREGVVHVTEGVAAQSDDDLIAVVLASVEYERLIPQVESTLWQYATAIAAPSPVQSAPVEEPLTDLKMMMYNSVDLLVARIQAKFTRFQMGYEAREAAAIAFKNNGYVGDPTEWVSRFADNTGMTYRAATDRILEQATLFRTSLMELENFRMDKYLILQAGGNVQAKESYDTIVNGCLAIERKLA